MPEQMRRRDFLSAFSLTRRRPCRKAGSFDRHQDQLSPHLVVLSTCMCVPGSRTRKKRRSSATTGNRSHPDGDSQINPSWEQFRHDMGTVDKPLSCMSCATSGRRANDEIVGRAVAAKVGAIRFGEPDLCQATEES